MVTISNIWISGFHFSGSALIRSWVAARHGFDHCL